MKIIHTEQVTSDYFFHTHRTSHKWLFLPTVEIKDYHPLIDGKKSFDESVTNDIKAYNNIRKITTGQGDDYATGYLLYYPFLTTTNLK